MSSPATQKDDTLHLSFDLLEVQQVKEGTNLSDSSHALRGKIRELMGDRLKNNARPRETSTNVATISKSPPKTRVKADAEAVPKPELQQDADQTQKQPEPKGWKKKLPLVERTSPPTKKPDPPVPEPAARTSRKALDPSADVSAKKKLLVAKNSPQRSVRTDSPASPKEASPAVLKSPPRAIKPASGVRASKPQFETVDDRRLDARGNGVSQKQYATNSKPTVRSQDLITELLHNLKLSSVVSVKDLDSIPLEGKSVLTMRDQSRLNEKIIEILADKIISEKENRVQTEIQIDKLTTQNQKQIDVLEKMLKKSQSQLGMQADNLQEKSPLKGGRLPAPTTVSSSRLKEVPSTPAIVKTPTPLRKRV